MIRRPPRSTQSRSSAASDVYKRQDQLQARTECNRVINFPFQNIGFIGKLVDIKVEEALAYSLLGTLHNNKELI